MIGYVWVKDQWEVELDKASRSGLRDRLEIFMFFNCNSREQKLKVAQAARTAGRQIDSIARSRRWIANPRLELQKSFARSEAGKKAARRRKREAKKQKGAR